jgi:hypothetical protein
MAFLRTIPSGRLALAARRRWAGWLLVAALLGAAGAPAFAQTPTSAEYKVKAVFLFNFAQFVEWPANAFRDAQAPLVIGVLGEDPFGTYLDEAVKGEKIGTRPLVVRRFSRVGDITDCHILFISRSESAQLDKIIAGLKGRSLLTVGDTDTFIRKGGVVRFVTENNKIRLRINVEAAKASDLTISSKLLRPATIVTAEND